MDKRYSIKELAELGGVSRRTVRYYVQRGLIPGPVGSGRGAHYTPAHLDALVRVRSLQEQGLSLGQLQEAPGMKSPTPAVRPAPLSDDQSVWTRVTVADGVELHLRRNHAVDSDTMEALRAAIAGVLKLES